MDWISVATGILGGVGLVLLGMRLLTEGLRIAAGRALRNVLERWTATRMRALLSGILMTSLVQSSSAVTVVVIGFANAGLLGLSQAVVVIYGSNVGTTVTAWLVALIGLHANVNALALPAIGFGMALRIAGGARRYGAIGETLAGFGLFFLGIDILRDSLSGMQSGLTLSALDVTGAGSVILFTLVGFVLTLVMQSSSAAIAIILTSVGGDVIPIEAGACLVIGANLGTTSTAAIAVVGATSNAKRVATAHVAFNGMAAAVALLTLPLLLLVVGRFREAFGLGVGPAAVLAGFHTLFNLLGVALMWPLTDSLVAMLSRLFRTPEEDEGRTRYLDRNVLSTPFLAIGALGLELARMGSIVREMAQQSLRNRASATELGRRRESLNDLITAMGEFVTALQRLQLPSELDAALPAALRVGRYYAEAAELAQSIAASHDAVEVLASDLDRRVKSFERDVMSLLDATSVDADGTSTEVAAQTLDVVLGNYHALKDALLKAGAEGRVPVADLVTHLDRLSNVRRLAEQMERGARYLRHLGSLVSGDEGEAVDPGLETSTDEVQGSDLP
jgi:phosphate:Na+ symporter